MYVEESEAQMAVDNVPLMNMRLIRQDECSWGAPHLL